MFLQVPPPGEDGRAPSAAERLGPCVLGGPVVLEVVSPVEGLLAQVTLVGLLPSVVPHVAVPVGAGGEVLAAVLAQVPLVLGHRVRLEVVEVVEHSLAELAGVDLVGVGDGLEDRGGVSVRCWWC